jgi:hypothetical protein
VPQYADQLAQLEDPDRRVVIGERHGKARVGSGTTLPVRPGNELLEAVQRGRRRRDETRNFLGRQQREERRRIGRTQFSQHHLCSRERRQARPPIGADRNRLVERRLRERRLHVEGRLVWHLFH